MACEDVPDWNRVVAIQGGACLDVPTYGTPVAFTPDATPFMAARIRRSTNQSIPNNSPTDVSFDTEEIDTSGFWSAGNPARLVIPAAGVYAVGFQANWANSAVGIRQVDISSVDVGTIYSSVAEEGQAMGASPGFTQLAITIARFVADEVLRVQVLQSSGGALNLQAGVGNRSVLWAFKVAD